MHVSFFLNIFLYHFHNTLHNNVYKVFIIFILIAIMYNTICRCFKGREITKYLVSDIFNFCRSNIWFFFFFFLIFLYVSNIPERRISSISHVVRKCKQCLACYCIQRWKQPYSLHRLHIYTVFLAMLSCLTLIILWRQILWFKPHRQRNKQCFKHWTFFRLSFFTRKILR